MWGFRNSQAYRVVFVTMNCRYSGKLGIFLRSPLLWEVPKDQNTVFIWTNCIWSGKCQNSGPRNNGPANQSEGGSAARSQPTPPLRTQPERRGTWLWARRPPSRPGCERSLAPVWGMLIGLETDPNLFSVVCFSFKKSRILLRGRKLKLSNKHKRGIKQPV